MTTNAMTTNDTNYAATAMSDSELDTVVGGLPLAGAIAAGVAIGLLFSRIIKAFDNVTRK